MSGKELRCYEDLPPSPVTHDSSLVFKTGSWRTMRPVISKEKCKLCGFCWKFCPDVSIFEDSEGYPAVDYDYCKGCGICANECPFDAITMLEEDAI
ncbi:MAG: 4Fe-4S binding protein [Candidatus Methanofastidiosa archaeon]|nr:4Fe-4S binding protein [Candidatus Methanofastidiosa archaeon]